MRQFKISIHKAGRCSARICFFEDKFDIESIKVIEFYQSLLFTNPLFLVFVNSMKLGKTQSAHELLKEPLNDMDDYNKEVEEGPHITSMAGVG